MDAYAKKILEDAQKFTTEALGKLEKEIKPIPPPNFKNPIQDATDALNDFTKKVKETKNQQGMKENFFGRSPDWDQNTLCLWENLELLNEIPKESIDLIYLDPPFNSNRNYIIVDK